MYFYDKFVNNQNILINISVLTTALTKNTEKQIALFQVHVLVYVRVLSSKFFFSHIHLSTCTRQTEIHCKFH